MNRFTPAQLAWVKEECKEMIYFFGYAKTAKEPENSTGFFEYDTVDEQFERKYKFFKT